MQNTGLRLVIGNKNLSSWSLRPWLVLRQAGIPFEEQKIMLDRPDSRAALKAQSPSGLVPCLIDTGEGDDFAIWDSLAICEYLAEKFPEKQLWPRPAAARARARSLANEMHSGFAELRTVWPMIFAREDIGLLTGPALEKDITRILSLWRAARLEFGMKAQDAEAGPFLFGRFSIADAMFAPVISRFKTYGPLPKKCLGDDQICQDYMDMIWALPAMKSWGDGARKEVQEEAEQGT